MSGQPGLPGIPAGSDAGCEAGETDAALSIEAAAVRFLAVREHSTRELRDKLSARFADTGLIEQVLVDLQQRKLLSDERFTEQYVSLRTRKGFGPLRIRAELVERGIDSALIDSWLDPGPRAWAEQMREVARQRFGDTPAHDRKEQARRARFLQYRGFPESLIRSYLWD
jgi:regulatory protein